MRLLTSFSFKNEEGLSLELKFSGVAHSLSREMAVPILKKEWHLMA